MKWFKLIRQNKWVLRRKEMGEYIGEKLSTIVVRRGYYYYRTIFDSRFIRYCSVHHGELSECKNYVKNKLIKSIQSIE